MVTVIQEIQGLMVLGLLSLGLIALCVLVIHVNVLACSRRLDEMVKILRRAYPPPPTGPPRPRPTPPGRPLRAEMIYPEAPEVLPDVPTGNPPFPPQPAKPKTPLR